jgi:hypothetical protein
VPLENAKLPASPPGSIHTSERAHPHTHTNGRTVCEKERTVPGKNRAYSSESNFPSLLLLDCRVGIRRSFGAALRCCTPSLSHSPSLTLSISLDAFPSARSSFCLCLCLPSFLFPLPRPSPPPPPPPPTTPPPRTLISFYRLFSIYFGAPAGIF